MPDPAVGDIERELDLLRDAGINCIRLSGCFTYGSAALIAACDRRGVLVWHDLMFSVLDYPAHDEAFVALCESEVAQQVALLQGSPSVLAICGSSEVEQQAAMSGVELAAVPHPLFHDLLARVVKHTLPDAAYWPSTPFGGEIPFRTDVGTTHYFGVGAYRRPLDDARRAAVRFATECLAFSHLPEPESPSSLPYDAADAESHARWKSRIPRDGGADWDFEDVRDHYVDALFGVESSSLRLGDPLRYLALGRAASAIVVERTMHEFRRTASSCQGALTWLWSDPWAGAGWGLVDSVGRPKSAWYAMRRALRSVGMALTDEGLNGVAVHLWNDSPHAVEGELHVRLLRADGSVVQAGICRLTVPAHDGHVRSTTEVLGRFVDPSCAYRFGADRHDAVHAVWLASGSADDRSAARGSSFEGRALIDDAVLLVAGDRRAPSPTGLDARVDHREHDGTVALAISSSRVAQAVRIGSVSHRADDSYFTLAPGVTRLVRLVPQSADAEVDALVVIECLNDASAIRLQVPWPNALVESPRVPRLLSPTGVESRC
jgi:beta-mannosidase